MMNNPKTVDTYISSFPKVVQDKLRSLRKTIQTSAPNAVESISYGMPAYKINNKPLVYFGGFKTHIGLYATPSGHERFKNELSGYKQGKGSVQFPLDQELPLELIAKIVTFRVQETNRKS